MYSISDNFKNKKDWIVANLGAKKNLLESLAAEIYNEGKLKHLFIKSEFSFSFKGFGFSIEGKEPISDIMSLLKTMLNYLKKKDIKLLITIDEVDNSDEMKYFIQGYAALLGQKYPLRLLMAGLYHNISLLQNEKSLTFLYRGPKIQIGPLLINSIAYKYSDLLNIDYDRALEFAKFTKGYAYAYQVLGYFLFESNKKEIDKEILLKYDQQLTEYVYGKVYSEMSDFEKKIVKVIEDDQPVKMADLSSKLNKTTTFLSVYRNNLIKEGILYSPSYGYVSFLLPRFEFFLKGQIF